MSIPLKPGGPEADEKYLFPDREVLHRAPRSFDCTFNYDSWTNADLFRAIECDPTCAQVYLDELTARAHRDAAQQELQERVASQYGIVPTYRSLLPLTWREKLAYYVSRIRLAVGV